MIRKALVKRGSQVIEVMVDDNTFKKGGSNMIKRKDGSYSQRGLWDNIRANKGSGKQPTKQMLEQEKKIRNKKQTGGEETYGNYMLPEFEITENTGMYNPNIVGPSAPKYIPSETGFVPNPYYTTGSGSAESVPLEMFAAPIMRGASSLIGMIPQNVMTGLGAGTMLGLEGCAPGQKCKGLDALPQRTKYKTSKRKKRRRKKGGEEDFHTPDTGIEQFAPDQSWYEGNPNASAPGNIVSWPSYPKRAGVPISELPTEAIPQRVPPSQGSIYLRTGKYANRSSNPMISLDNDYSIYQDYIPEYRRNFDLFNRIGQGFNNVGEEIGEGFDNLGEFFKKVIKGAKKLKIGKRIGKGLSNCKPGTKCEDFRQMGGEESDQMEEILDQIEDALEQGVKSEEILLQLTEMGIDEEQAQMLVQQAMQDLQEDATENELPEAQGGGHWMDDPSGEYSFDEQLRKKIFPLALITGAIGGIPMYLKHRKEKKLEEQERIKQIEEETSKKKLNKKVRGGEPGKGDPCGPGYIKDSNGNCVPTNSELYNTALEQYKFFQENPQAWINDPDYKNPDGSFNLCLDCINVDWNNPNHISDVTRLIEEGFTTGPHYDETKTTFANKLKEFQMSEPIYGRLKPVSSQKYGGLVKAQTGLITGGDNKKKKLVSKEDYAKMISEEKSKKENEERKRIEEKNAKDSFYYNNPARWKNYDAAKFNDPNLQPRIVKQCGGGDIVWEYDECPEEIETSTPVKKPTGTYSNSPTGKNYYINLYNPDSRRTNHEVIDARALQDYFDKYDLTYTHSGSAGLTGNPINANLMYNSELPVGEYYDLSSTQDGQPIHYYNTPNAQFFQNSKEMGGGIDVYSNGGSYRVYKTSERKGKTHKVVGPGGVTKYFGDPKLGERSKSKYGKKAFYARHKKNLANNPFFRAYARATWAEGGEPTFMNKPEFKSSSFIEKVKQLGQQNLEKNLFEQFEEEQNQMMMAAGGYMDDPSYIKNPQIDMFNQARQKLGNPINDALKAFNDWGLKTEKKIEQAATALGMAFGVPGAGKMVKAGFDMARPKTGNENQTASAGTSGSGGMGNMLNSIMGSVSGSGGAGAAGAASGMDISQLASLFGARYGGSMRKFQNAGQFIIPQPTEEDFNQGLFGQSIEDDILTSGIPDAPIGFESPEDWRIRMKKQPEIYGENKNWDPLTFSKKDMKKYNLDPNFNNVIQKPKTPDLSSFTGQAVTAGLPLGVALLGAMGRERKFDKLNAESSNFTLADNSFLATEQPNRGDYTLNEGFFRPDEQGMPGANYAIPRLSAARYGGNLRRAQNGLENVISFAGDRYVENYLPAGNNQKPLTNEYFRNINYYSDMPSDTTYGYVSAPGGNQYIINSRLTPQSERDLSKEEMIKRKLKVKKHGGVQKDGMYLSYPTATPESVVYGEQPRKISNTLSPVKREFANLEAEGGETVITPAGIDGLPKFFKIRGKRHSEGGAPLNLPDNSFIFSDTRSMKFSKDILEEFGIKGKNKKTPAQISGILGNGYDQYIKIIQDPNSDSIERKTAEMMIRNQIILLGKLAVAQESKKGFPQGIPMIAIPYLESMGISPEELLPQIPNQQNNMGELGNQQQMPEMSMQQMPMARYGMQKYQTGREKQTNPLITSGPSTPDNPNIAQRILGPIFNLAAGLPEETNIPVRTAVGPYTKGLGDYEQEEEFIQKATDLGDQDFKPLVDEYKGRLEALDILRTGLLSGNISQAEYNSEKDRILNEINALSPVLQKIDLPGSWEYWPGSTQNKISNMISILGEETKKLEDTETFVTKLNTKNQNIDELVREKAKIEEMLKEKGIGNLTKYQLGEDLKNITKAINSEIYEREKFSRDFTGGYYNETDSDKAFIRNNRPHGFNEFIDPTLINYRNKNSRSPERYTYDDYMTYKNKNVSKVATSKPDSSDILNIDLSMPTSVIDSSATKDSSGVNTPADSSRVVESTPIKQKQKQSSNRNQTVNKSKIRTKTKLKFATGATEE